MKKGYTFRYVLVMFVMGMVWAVGCGFLPAQGGKEIICTAPSKVPGEGPLFMTFQGDFSPVEALEDFLTYDCRPKAAIYDCTRASCGSMGQPCRKANDMSGGTGDCGDEGSGGGGPADPGPGASPSDELDPHLEFDSDGGTLDPNSDAGDDYDAGQ